MPRVPDLTLPLPDPLALLQATTLFVLQLLLAQHPELLAAPEETPTPPTRALGHASLLLHAVRELHYAIEVYRSCLPGSAGGNGEPDDGIPF